MRLSSLIVLSLCPQDHTWSLTCVRLFAVPWNAAHQAPLSLGFSRQEHWSGFPFPSPMHESEKWKWSLSVVSTLSHPLACSLPGSFVHGIFQARVLEWVAIPFSRVSSWPQDWTQVSCIAGRYFTVWATREAQEIPEVTGKFGLGVQNEARQRLTKLCQENALIIANTLFQQHKRRLYTGASPAGQYQNQIDYILCSQRWISSIQSAKIRPGADCGSDHELLVAKFRLKLKKVGKTPRPFRYDLNQILYDYTVEVTNRFKGLDLIECPKNYGWKFMTLYRRQWSRP